MKAITGRRFDPQGPIGRAQVLSLVLGPVAAGHVRHSSLLSERTSLFGAKPLMR